MTVKELIEKLDDPKYHDYPVVIVGESNYVEVIDITLRHGDYENETGKTIKGYWMITLDT